MNPREQELTDLQILRILEGGAYAAVISWAEAAAQAHDPKLRRCFGDMAHVIVRFQGEVRALLKQMGGAI